MCEEVSLFAKLVFFLFVYRAEFDCFQIELSKNYGVAEWREDLKKVMMKAGLQNVPVVFLFSDTQVRDADTCDTNNFLDSANGISIFCVFVESFFHVKSCFPQIKSESFLEDLNNILNSGDVPNIYVFDELDQIYTAMKPLVQEAQLAPTKTNLFAAYTRRIRTNLHTVIAMRSARALVCVSLYVCTYQGACACVYASTQENALALTVSTDFTRHEKQVCDCCQCQMCQCQLCQRICTREICLQSDRGGVPRSAASVPGPGQLLHDRLVQRLAGGGAAVGGETLPVRHPRAGRDGRSA